MATKIAKVVADTLAAVSADVFGKTETKRTKLAASFLTKGWAYTVARMDVGRLMVTEYQSLRSAYIAATGSDKDVPTDELTDAVLATWKTLGVFGFSWDAVADWDRAYGAYHSCTPDFRKAMADYGHITVTTLKDAAQVPLDGGKTKDGKPIAPREEVLAAVVASGETTDKAQRLIVKTARNGGVAPAGKAKLTIVEQAAKIGGNAAELLKTFPHLDRADDGTVTLDIDGVNALVRFGVQLRAIGGSYDVRAYDNVIAAATFPEESIADVIPAESDGSGAEDAS